MRRRGRLARPRAARELTGGRGTAGRRQALAWLGRSLAGPRRLAWSTLVGRFATVLSLAWQTLIGLQVGVDHGVMPAGMLVLAADPHQDDKLAFRMLGQGRPDHAGRQIDMRRQRDDRMARARRRPDARRRLRQFVARAWAFVDAIVRISWATGTAGKLARTRRAPRRSLVGMLPATGLIDKLDVGELALTLRHEFPPFR